MRKTTFRSILTALLLVFVLATGCAPASQVAVVEVIAPPEVRVIEVTATPAPVPTPTPPPPTTAPDIETPQEPPLALVGGTLIDGTGADPLPDAALVVQGERILAVGSRAEVTIPPDARVVELDGATVLPGFINTHVHNTYVKHTLRTWGQAGVTTVTRDFPLQWVRLSLAVEIPFRCICIPFTCSGHISDMTSLF